MAMNRPRTLWFRFLEHFSSIQAEEFKYLDFFQTFYRVSRDRQVFLNTPQDNSKIDKHMKDNDHSVSCDWLEQAEENEKESNREKIMFEVFSHWELQTFLEKFRFLFVAVYFKVGYTKNHCKQWRGNTNRQIHILVDTIHMHGNGIWEASTMWSDATNYKRSQSLQIYNINVSISFEIEIFGSKPAIELNSFWKYSKYSWENGTYVCGHYASRKYSI